VYLKENDKALAMTVDCTSRYVYADPHQGCAIAVAEAARNISCSGGIPSAITNCLNFGNPYNPEVYWQFVGSIKGMSEACNAFKTPVTGGNVSFYNQSLLDGKEEAVFPTPTIGMIGTLEDKALATGLSFKKEGNGIFLIGDHATDINSSEYLYAFHKVLNSPAPNFNLTKEIAVQKTIQSLIRLKLVDSAHDCSDGGLFITLCEKGFEKDLGFNIKIENKNRLDMQLFGESQSRIVISVSPEKTDELSNFLVKEKIPFSKLGEVTKSDVIINGETWTTSITKYRKIHENALEKALNISV